MKVCVTGATGFLGAHVARLVCERGDELTITYRNPERLHTLRELDFRRRKAEVLDYKAMRRAVRGTDILFHTVGYVGSSPLGRVWQINARGPVIAVEAAAAEGVGRVVVTSTISALGPAPDRNPTDEWADYPDDWLGLAYPDSKHEGERAAIAAGERHGIEVVVVNPAYVLGVPIDRTQPGETSTRIIGNYLRGRLPGVIDAPMNFVDVEDAARGHLLAADRGAPGERYILGGENIRWPHLIDRVAELSGTHYPILVMPPEVTRLARIREALNLPSLISVEGYELMAKDWRFSSERAERELGYRPRPLDETVSETVDWYLELMRANAFPDNHRSGLSMMAGAMRGASRLGLLTPIRVGQRLLGRRVIAGI
jgi:dihydroflavonol-4-reductase